MLNYLVIIRFPNHHHKNKILSIAPIAVEILCVGVSQKQRIVTNSGREVLMKIIRSAPKKKDPQIFTCGS